MQSCGIISNQTARLMFISYTLNNTNNRIMKHLFLNMAIAGALVAALASCDSKSKLAESVAGTWASQQQTIANDAQGVTSGNDIFSFQVTDKNKEGGTVSIASTLSLTHAADALTPADAPFSTSVAATASISGTWKAIDDDELLITLDPNSLQVAVDPDAVALTSNPLTGVDQSKIDSLRPQMARFYQTELTNTLRAHYSQYTRIDDVKTKENGSILKIEVKDQDMMLQRQ